MTRIRRRATLLPGIDRTRIALPVVLLIGLVACASVVALTRSTPEFPPLLVIGGLLCFGPLTAYVVCFVAAQRAADSPRWIWALAYSLPWAVVLMYMHVATPHPIPTIWRLAMLAVLVTGLAGGVGGQRRRRVHSIGQPLEQPQPLLIVGVFVAGYFAWSQRFVVDVLGLSYPLGLLAFVVFGLGGAFFVCRLAVRLASVPVWRLASVYSLPFWGTGLIQLLFGSGDADGPGAGLLWLTLGGVVFLAGVGGGRVAKTSPPDHLPT